MLSKEEDERLGKLISEWAGNVMLSAIKPENIAVVKEVALDGNRANIENVGRVVECIDPNCYHSIRMEADEIIGKYIGQPYRVFENACLAKNPPQPESKTAFSLLEGAVCRLNTAFGSSVPFYIACDYCLGYSVRNTHQNFIVKVNVKHAKVNVFMRGVWFNDLDLEEFDLFLRTLETNAAQSVKPKMNVMPLPLWSSSVTDLVFALFCVRSALAKSGQCEFVKVNRPDIRSFGIRYLTKNSYGNIIVRSKDGNYQMSRTDLNENDRTINNSSTHKNIGDLCSAMSEILSKIVE